MRKISKLNIKKTFTIDIWVYHGEDRRTDDNFGYASTSNDNMQF